MSKLEEIRSRWIIPPGGKAYWPDGCDDQDEDVRNLLAMVDAAEAMADVFETLLAYAPPGLMQINTGKFYGSEIGPAVLNAYRAAKEGGQ